MVNIRIYVPQKADGVNGQGKPRTAIQIITIPLGIVSIIVKHML